MAKFSVIIPVFNVVEYLEKCVDSVLTQTFQDIEIILIDDGSTDGSEAMCDVLGSKDVRIHVYHKKNGGLSDTRNWGIDRATGEYLLFLDSDDYVDKDLCENLSCYIDELGMSPDVVTIQAIKIANGETEGFIKYSVKDKTVISGKDFLKREFQKGKMSMTGWLSVCRREYLNLHQLRFFAGILHEDEEFIPRLFLNAEKVASSNIPGYYYVQREGSITKSKSLRKNAVDINFITVKLEKIYKEVEDQELQKYLLNSLVTKRLNIYQCGRLIGKEYQYLYDKAFIRRNAKCWKNKCKVTLFIFSPNLYYWINILAKQVSLLIR